MEGILKRCLDNVDRFIPSLWFCSVDVWRSTGVVLAVFDPLPIIRRFDNDPTLFVGVAGRTKNN